MRFTLTVVAVALSASCSSGGAGSRDAGARLPATNDAATRSDDAGQSASLDSAAPFGADGGAQGGGIDDAISASSADASSQANHDAGGDAGAVVCGTTPAAFDVTKIGGIEQIASAPDGTLYFSTSPFTATIGRYAPPYTTVEHAWKTVPDPTAQILGIALDPRSNVLYAGARTTNRVYKIPVAGTGPVVSVNIPDGQFNGATLGPDGALYYTNEMASGPTANVYRLGPADTAPTQVNTSPIVHANDLAFGPDGWLYVNQWILPATVTRLQLANGTEQAREVFVTLSVAGTPPGNGDGIAFDSAGNFYALAGALYMVTPAKTITVLPSSSTPTSGMEFGCGALSCNDLLFATSAGVSKITLSIPGMVVPWHQD